MTDPTLIPGLLAAADICDRFEQENFAVSHDLLLTRFERPDLRIPGGDGSWSLSLADHEHIHVCQAHAARQIAEFLRRMAGGAQ